MSLHTARVAPEKTAFRPVLPLCFLPGFTEKHMTKKRSYFEKLKDPRWQKKRLERLEMSEWRCDSCCDDESTLHVHHKAYFKGREPWEYDVKQLSTLCESCHQDEHESENHLMLAVSYVDVDGGPYSAETLASVVAGFCMQEDFGPDPDIYMLARIISAMPKRRRYGGLDALEAKKIAEEVECRGAEFCDLLRAFAGITRGGDA